MKKRLFQRISAVASVAAALAFIAPASWAARGSVSREVRNEFFIVSEVNLPKHKLVLEMPSQTTMVVRMDAKTEFINRHGRRMPLADIEAGDTVYVTYAKVGKPPLALEIRSGPMTVKILHQRYWEG